VRRIAPVLLASLLLLAATANAAAPTVPRAMRISSGGHTLPAALIHTCITTGDSTACTAPHVRLKGSLKVRAGGKVTLRLDHAATSVTVSIQRDLTRIGLAGKARGSGRTWRWTLPRSLGKANRINAIANVGRSDAEFAVAIRH
jgi:hypothetical protein